MIPNLPGWLAWRANVKGRRAPGWTRHVPAQLGAEPPASAASIPQGAAPPRPDFDVVRRYVNRGGES